jgi:thiol-disulfide isomerase/thioredoxin
MRITSVLVFYLLAVGIMRAAPRADLTAKNLDGQKVRLKEMRGNLVVLNFWATWCGPCKEEMPMLVRIAKENPMPGLKFIAVSVDDRETQDKVGEMARHFGISFPVWVGANADDLYRLSNGEALPATIFIDRDGTIVARVSGEIRESELKDRISWLTGDRSGKAPEEFVSHAK